MAGTSGEITLSLYGKYAGMAGSGLTKSVAIGDFGLSGQKFPFRCTPQGVLTIDTSAIVPGSATNDPSHMNPFGIGESEIGMQFGTSSDGSTFVMETITFTSGGSGVSVGIYGVGIPVAGGGTNSHSVGMRINIKVIGGQVAPAPAKPASTTADASAGATATVTGAVPAHVAVPSPHSILFEKEGQTKSDQGDLVRWAASLSPDAQSAIRTGRLTVTVLGYASTTGAEKLNFDYYARQRAEWVRGFSRTLSASLPQRFMWPRGVPTRHLHRNKHILACPTLMSVVLRSCSKRPPP